MVFSFLYDKNVDQGLFGTLEVQIRNQKIANSDLPPEEMNELISQTLIPQQIKDTVEHNYNLIMNTDWTSYAVYQIRELITSAQVR